MKSSILIRCIALIVLPACSAELFGQCTPHTISTVDKDEIIYACSGDGRPDNYVFIKSDTSTNTKYGYVLADQSDNIIRVQNTPSFNFDGPTAAGFRVWGISYSDSITFKTGQDVSTIKPVKGCARLSENVIRVVRDRPSANDALFATGSRDTFICFNNATKDTLMMQPPSSVNSKHVFLVTISNGNIVDFFEGNTYVPENLPSGIYFIYAVAYTGNLTFNLNNKIFSTNISNGCFSISQRSARLNHFSLVAGTVEALTTTTIFCPKNNKPDTFKVSLIEAGSFPVALVLLDANNIVRGISTQPFIDLNPYDEGSYTLRALSYSGKLTLQLNDTIDILSNDTLSTDCSDWSSSKFDIKLVVPKAGKLNSTVGDSLLFACPGDRLPDRIVMNVTDQSPLAGYVIVVVDNKDNKILAMINPGGFVDFEAFSAGTCKAYGVAYTGSLLIEVGDIFSGAISTDCVDITKKVLTINKDVAKGGLISLKGGETIYYACPDNDSTRKIEFERRNSSNSPYLYVLTSENGVIIDFVQNDSLSFQNLLLPSMRIYGVAYSGKRVLDKLGNLFVSSFSDGCFSVSENFIRVVNDRPRGGGVRLPDGGFKELFCPSDRSSKTLTLRNVDVSQHPYRFILTDSSQNVLDIFPNFTYSFDSLKQGVYNVYGVSYTGNIVLKKGQRLDLSVFSDDCFNFSVNRIDVIIGEINGGILTTSEGSANVFTCPSNLDPDPIQMIPLWNKSLSYRYVITNEQNIIQAFSSVDQIDFGNAAINSICRVYGVAYKGDFTGVLGRNVLQTAFSTACYDLSDNFVSVRKTVPPQHRLLTSEKDSIITLCIRDSKKDSIRLSTSDSMGFKTVFVGVESGKISKIYTSKTIQFDTDSTGLITIYSLIYTGRLLAVPGLSFVNGLALSDDCFSLSPNSLTVDRVNKGPFCLFVSTKEDFWIKRLKVYPNPISGISPVTVDLTVDHKLINKNGSITLSDMHGRVFFEGKFKFQLNTILKMDKLSLHPGIYNITVRSEKDLITRKVVIY